MPASIGVNLRVTGHCRQGGRKYMEDFFTVAYQQTEDEKDLEYAFFGIYDGHGGAEAAAFAKEHLMESIVKHRGFWSDDDDEVLRSIKDGFLHTHLAMWKIHDKWPKTSSGLPSTAGTTASIAFIRRAKIYIGHVGDSGIILGYQDPGSPDWKARALTKEHKPESEDEMNRINESGGKVVCKAGVARVVWNRPRIGHKGPVRRSTPIDEIPFLAVARSLGDLWSYNSAQNQFVVSPTPDVSVIPIDTATFRCLIFGTDGLYNMLSPSMAVHIVQQAERHNEKAALSDAPNKIWVNPSKCLVEKALEKWSMTKMRADNTSVITLMLDPPGPPRAQVLRNKKHSYSSSGLQIETRYTVRNDGTKIKTTSTPSPQLPPQPKLELPEEKTKVEEEPSTDLSKLADVVAEVDRSFVARPRESLPPETVKKEDDIQINEVSSSSSADDELKKKKKPPVPARKINLRSNKEKDEISSSRTARRTKEPESLVQTEPNENKRVLRNQNKPSFNTTNKRGVLQNVLTRNNNKPAPPPKKSAAPPMAKPTTPKNIDVKQRTKLEKREVRKSTLAKKLRIHQELFKAKLRCRSSPSVTKRVLKDKISTTRKR